MPNHIWYVSCSNFRCEKLTFRHFDTFGQFVEKKSKMNLDIYLVVKDARHVVVGAESEDPWFARLLTTHCHPRLEVRIGGVGGGGPGGAPLAQAAHNGRHREAVPVYGEAAIDLLHPRLVVWLGPVATLVVRGEVEGVNDALLVSAQAPLHDECVLVTPDQVKVRGDIPIDIPRLAKLPQP